MSASAREKRVREARHMMAWLCFECPLGGNPADCPAHAMRLQSFEARRRTLSRMSDDECIALYERHTACNARKEAMGRQA